MLSESDISVSKVLSFFTSYQLEVCFLVPTETGMNKSIMDATGGVRSYFESNGIHNYSSQPQGPENKITRSAYYVFDDHVEETQVSLYRPNTKSGDPRIWFYGLKEYAVPYNLLAILLHQGFLYVINCSNTIIFNRIQEDSEEREYLELEYAEGDKLYMPTQQIDRRSLSMPSTYLGKIASQSRPKESDIALELYDKLKKISSLGYVQTIIPGPTGIGMTLQNLLGIKTDSSSKPDYKGIEIKSKRIARNETRFNLFGRKPEWDLSPIGSPWNLLIEYGYIGKGGKRRLSHQMDTIKPNSRGLILDLDWSKDWLKLNYCDEYNSTTTNVSNWKMQILIDRLLEKHAETFWVYADTRGKGKSEEFHYITVKHTKSPIVDNFYSLLETGSIYHDLTLSVKDETKETVRDHGYLFKMWSDDVPALIPLVNTYDLTAK